MIIIILIIVAFFIWLIVRLIKTYSEDEDERGYLRDGYGRLIHRNIAYKNLYKYPFIHDRRFRDYVVHHIDGNKKNNNIDNLQILTKEEHNGIHDTGNHGNFKKHYDEEYFKKLEKEEKIKESKKFKYVAKKYSETVEEKEKKHNCEDCNRPINHKGCCLPCNVKRKKIREMEEGRK